MRRMLLRVVVVAIMGAFAAVMAVPAFAAGEAVGAGGCQTDPETGETLSCGGGGTGSHPIIHPDGSYSDVGGGGFGGYDQTMDTSRGGGGGRNSTIEPDGSQGPSSGG